MPRFKYNRMHFLIMKVTFIGVGSASDSHYPNVSIYVQAKTANILLDCGVTIIYELFKRQDILMEADALYISHRHADHFFGVPTLLLRVKKHGRTKPFIIFGYRGMEKYVTDLMKIAYSTLLDDVSKLPFKVNFVEFEKKKEMLGLKFELAPTVHPEINMAVKITEGNKSIVYSGDGMFSEEGKKLYANTDLLIHESFTIDEREEGHANAFDLIQMSKGVEVKALALIHFGEEVRQEQMHRLRTIIKKEKANAFVPEPNTILLI